jgi:hypothetical protein
MRGSRAFCASACFSVAIVAAACAQEPSRRAAPRDGARQVAPTSPALPGDAALAATLAPSLDAAGLGRSGAPELGDARALAADPYLTGAPVYAKSIGHTSYVLKVRMDNGLIAAFKPQSKLPLGDRRYKGEIAAYRLGRALGLESVPIAVPRAFAPAALRRSFATPESAEDFDRRARVDEHGMVHGALMPWIERYDALPWEDGDARARWQGWLTDAAATIDAGDRAMASAMSTMIVFDYVTGNWDRWSGGNIVRDGSTGRLLYVDNDGAFYEAPPGARLSRQLALLQRVVRFSRRFVAALRALDLPSIREALGVDLDGAGLLPDSVVMGVDARRTAAVAAIDTRIALAGDGATLCFE